MLLSSSSLPDAAGLSLLPRGRRSAVYVDTVWAGSAQGASVSDPSAWFSAHGPFTFGVNAFATVQDGVNSVPSRGTVDVAAGTFTENVTISQPLTLNGANHDVSGTGKRSAETAIDGGSGVALAVNSPGVTINGIKAIGNTGINSGVGVTIKDDFINATSMGIDIGGTAAGDVVVSDIRCESSGVAFGYLPLSASTAPASTQSLIVIGSSISGGISHALATGITIGGLSPDIMLASLTISGDTVTTSSGPDVYSFAHGISIGTLTVNNNVLTVANGSGQNIAFVTGLDGSLVLGDHSSISGNLAVGAGSGGAIVIGTIGGTIAIGDGSVINDNTINVGADTNGFGADGIDIFAQADTFHGQIGAITFGSAGTDTVSVCGNHIFSSSEGIAVTAGQVVLNSALCIGRSGHSNVIASTGDGVLINSNDTVGKPISFAANAIEIVTSRYAPGTALYHLLAYGNWSAPVDINANTIAGMAGSNGISVLGAAANAFSGPVTIECNTIGGTAGGDAISIENVQSQTEIRNNQILGGYGIGIDLGQGFWSNEAADSNVSIIGNDIRNHSGTGILIELGVYGGSGVSIQNNFIENNLTGIQIAGALGGPISINYNSIGQDVSYEDSGNTIAGLDNESTVMVDARFNWWGDVSGPGGIGPGSGDKILGSNVNFTPWLTNGADADAPNRADGFQPSPLRPPRGPFDRWDRDSKLWARSVEANDRRL